MLVRNDAPAPAASDRPTYKLPPEAYFSQEWHDREQRDLFRRTWNLVAYETDLPGTGHLPVTVAGIPALLTRDADGTIRGFHNMCRHRGMALACEAGEGSDIRCPYHGWEFAVDGSLTRVPQRRAQFPDMDTADWGLVPLRTASWGGMVFIDPGGEAPALETWLADFPDHIGPFPRTDLVEVFHERFALKCNWKLYIENHIDCYHLWFLHGESMGALDHHQLTYKSCGEHWMCVEPLRATVERPAWSLNAMSWMDDDESRLTRANLIFPNVPQTSLASSFSTYQVIPTGPETCELDLRMWSDPAIDFTDEMVQASLQVLVEEDGFACEQMQRIVRSPSFQVGPLALVHEQPIAELHEKILRHLDRADVPAPASAV